MSLIEQAQAELQRMSEEAIGANAAARAAYARWQDTLTTEKQAEKDYRAAKRIADDTNTALIRALGGQ